MINDQGVQILNYKGITNRDRLHDVALKRVGGFGVGKTTLLAWNIVGHLQHGHKAIYLRGEYFTYHNFKPLLLNILDEANIPIVSVNQTRSIIETRSGSIYFVLARDNPDPERQAFEDWKMRGIHNHLEIFFSDYSKDVPGSEVLTLTDLHYLAQ